VRPDSDDAYYGITLCALKNGDPQMAFDSIEKAIRLVDEGALVQDEKIHLTYMRAVALKLLKRY
jgi:hypothetical protein